MIDFQSSLIITGSRTFPITKWEIWFRIPVGLTPNLKQAITWCQEHDLDPNTTIVPVAVAIAEGEHYEACG